MTGSEAKELVKERGAAPSRFLLDPKGTVGKAYGAKTTPHMFVIDPKGMVVYNGAIDDKPSTNRADIATATQEQRSLQQLSLLSLPSHSPNGPLRRRGGDPVKGSSMRC